MKLKIGDPLLVQLTRNLYKISIEFMEGDADSYKTTDVYIEPKQLENEEFNKELELFLKTMTGAYEKDKDGRGGYDDFEDMLEDHYKDNDLLRFFPDYYSIEPRRVELTPFNLFRIEWPTDPRGGFFFSFSKIWVTYFDDKGVEYSVTIEY